MSIRVLDFGAGIGEERRECRKVWRSDSTVEADLFWEERAHREEREGEEAVRQVVKKWVRADGEEVHSS